MATIVMKIVSGPSAGRTVVRTGGRVLIGRSSAADLRVDDPLVHWEHLAVRVGASEAVLDALPGGSALVNARRVESRTRLRDGDRIDLSEDSRIQVSVRGLARPRSHALLAAAALCAVIVLGLFLARDRVASRPVVRPERQALALENRLDDSGLNPAVLQKLRALLKEGRLAETGRDLVRAGKAYGAVVTLSTQILVGESASEAAAAARLPSARSPDFTPKQTIEAVRRFALARKQAVALAAEAASARRTLK